MRDFARLQVIGWVGRQTSVVGVAILFAVILAWLGALESARYDLFQRLGYWTVNLVGWSIISSLALSAMSWWSWATSLLGWQRVTIATVLSSIPMLAVTVATTMTISAWRPAPHELLQQLLSIWLIGGAYLFICEQLRHRQVVAPTVSASAPKSHSAPEEAGVAPIIGDALSERLPGSLGTEILCLRVEDHYVRVYTRRGDTLILTRFGDAILAVSSIPGIRVHRSWWVATAAVESLRRTGRTAELRLCNGVTVPVSQPYLAQANDHWNAALVA